MLKLVTLERSNATVRKYFPNDIVRIYIYYGSGSFGAMFTRLPDNRTRLYRDL